MVGGVSAKEHATNVFLNKDTAFDKARDAHEQASRLEDAARKEWHEAKEALAKAVGYKAGDPPVSIVVGDGRLIRLYTRREDRCGRDREQEVSVSIEKVV
jgi:hypothetical protein